MSFGLKKISDIFGKEIHRTSFLRAEEAGKIPTAERHATGAMQKRVWDIAQLPQIGKEFGFINPKLDSPAVISFFNTKGGILKTSIATNVARMAALHGVKTIVVGLDLQCDITGALGITVAVDEDLGLDEATNQYATHYGLHDLEQGRVSLDEIILGTDIPTLDVVPETSELHLLNINLTSKTNRELWLKKNVIDPLHKEHGYELVILDCSPNWNNLVTNAITSCDLLISPIECKINNYRNYPAFQKFIDSVKSEGDLNFHHVFIATRFSPSRKLSKEIRSWYVGNIPNCLSTAVKESIKGEEAMAAMVSLIEHAPKSLEAEEMRQLMTEVWSSLNSSLTTRKKSPKISEISL